MCGQEAVNEERTAEDIIVCVCIINSAGGEEMGEEVLLSVRESSVN